MPWFWSNAGHRKVAPVLLGGSPSEKIPVDVLYEAFLPGASLRIAGVERPAVMVRERFLKLEYPHMAYVLGCLRANTSRVGNIRSYLLTSLYNAVLIIDNYYRAEVTHDLYGIR